MANVMQWLDGTVLSLTLFESLLVFIKAKYYHHRYFLVYIDWVIRNKKLSWCWQTRTTRLEVSHGHQTWYHSIDWV